MYAFVDVDVGGERGAELFEVFTTRSSIFLINRLFFSISYSDYK
jgi:hypothetical protein